MARPLFPDPVFGWSFLAVLIVFLACAAYTDLRRAVVPKWVTISGLALGVAVSICRGAFLAANDAPLFCKFQTGNVWLGGLDGFLFALAGFGTGFGVFFAMWVLGGCGGGDVKLMAALGAWIGPMLVLLVLIVSAAFLLASVPFRIFSGSLSLKELQKRTRSLPTAANKPGAKGPVRGRMRMTYSLPVALATALLILWFYRVELRLAPPKAEHNERALTHAR